MKTRCTCVLVVCLFGLLLMGGTAKASLVAPGTTITSVDPFVGPPGTLLASKTENFVSVLGPTDFSGAVTEAVYRDFIAPLRPSE